MLSCDTQWVKVYHVRTFLSTIMIKSCFFCNCILFLYVNRKDRDANIEMLSKIESLHCTCQCIEIFRQYKIKNMRVSLIAIVSDNDYVSRSVYLKCSLAYLAIVQRSRRYRLVYGPWKISDKSLVKIAMFTFYAILTRQVWLQNNNRNIDYKMHHKSKQYIFQQMFHVDINFWCDHRVCTSNNAYV